jgi:prepilin-type N-terminal cleavage/methylation domain-containing protein
VSRRGFTLIELCIAVVITVIAAGAVAGTLRAVSEAMQEQDRVADASARLARVDARVADHLERARLILQQDGDEVLLWLPSEPFDSSASNTSDYDTIHLNELAWYVMDAANGTLTIRCAANRAARTAYPLSTNWGALRTTLQSQAQLSSTVVLEGLSSGAFDVEDADACSVRRFTFVGTFEGLRGGHEVRLGGRLANGQRHPDCP